ncbi:hypothetical protein ACYZT4_10715 [Pseudomonas sp. GB2N2]
MSHQFKQGDLALILVPNYQFTAMSTVSLVIFILEGQGAIEPDGTRWLAPYAGWIVEREGEDGYGFFRPQHLMPLRSDFSSEHQKSREVAA